MKKLLIAVLLVAFAMPALAFEIALPGENNKLNLYGQVRLYGGYLGTNNAQNVGNVMDESFAYGIQSNSRIGFDLNIGQFFGKVETSFMGDGETSTLNMNAGANPGAGALGFRLLYGGYKFDHGGTLTAGRMFILGETSLAFDSIWDGDGGMAGYGTILSYRRTGVKYGIAGFEIGIFQSNNNYFSTAAFANTVSKVKVNVAGAISQQSVTSTMTVADYYPEVQAAYNAKFGDMLSGKIFVTWTAFDMQNVMSQAGTTIDTQKQAVNQVTAGLVLKPKFGPVGISFSAIYAYNGQINNRIKSGGYSVLGYASFDDITASIDPVTGAPVSDLRDKWTGLLATHTYGVALEATYAITPIFSARLGAGYQSTSSEGLQALASKGKPVKSLDSLSLYVNAPIKLNQYMIAIPMVGYFAESKSNGEWVGKGSLFAGAQFRVIF